MLLQVCQSFTARQGLPSQRRLVKHGAPDLQKVHVRQVSSGAALARLSETAALACLLLCHPLSPYDFPLSPPPFLPFAFVNHTTSMPENSQKEKRTCMTCKFSGEVALWMRSRQ